MTARERLPDRRPCESFEIEAAGLRYVATIARYPDGRLGEIFLAGRKAGSAADNVARDAAITASIALQFGADVETIRRALCCDALGRASGPLGVVLDLLVEDKMTCRPTTPVFR
jgi:ribonucleoside-diphosphate reductase alpha chain